MHRLLVEPIIRAALLEDLGRAGDITTDAIVADDRVARGAIVARQDGVVAGLEAGLLAFALLDPACAIATLAPDGARVAAGETIATVEGRARAILTAERTALNVAGRLSGVATMTARFVAAVAGTRCRVACTRKTTPGLRALEKEAVRMGGGSNHRFGLDDAVLIKDNHIVVAGGLTAAVDRVRARIGHLVKVEVEVDTFAQLEEAIEIGVDLILLDNMSLEELRAAVAFVAGRAVLEASGSMRLDRVAAVAATGVDLLSVGALTHSSPTLDVGLDLA